jgi:acyl dehydratase
MRIRTRNQRDEPVLDFWRCAMIPLRDPAARTGHEDRFEGIPAELDPDRVAAAVPADWRYDAFRERAPGEHAADLAPGTIYEVEGRDTVTAAPELVRLTLNVAQVHADAAAGAHGRRLAYGGHTIAVAAAHLSRALPNLVTVLAWHGCDHTGPVFEGDVLASEVMVEAVDPLESADAALVHLRVRTTADRGDGGEPAPVLDWRPIGLMA